MTYRPSFNPALVEPGGTNAPENLADMAARCDAIMEQMAANNIAHPTLEFWLLENDYMNAIVRRVMGLRTSGEDPKAFGHVVRGDLLQFGVHVHFVCVVARSDGTYEDPDGKLVDLRERLLEQKGSP